MFLALKELATQAAELIVFTDWAGPLQGISVAATLFVLFVLYCSSPAPIISNNK
jgi:hypothetical protein